jgi:hypothetical protein
MIGPRCLTSAKDNVRKRVRVRWCVCETRAERGRRGTEGNDVKLEGEVLEEARLGHFERHVAPRDGVQGLVVARYSHLNHARSAQHITAHAINTARHDQRHGTATRSRGEEKESALGAVGGLSVELDDVEEDVHRHATRISGLDATRNEHDERTKSGRMPHTHTRTHAHAHAHAHHGTYLKWVS